MIRNSLSIGLPPQNAGGFVIPGAVGTALSMPAVAAGANATGGRRQAGRPKGFSVAAVTQEAAIYASYFVASAGHAARVPAANSIVGNDAYALIANDGGASTSSKANRGRKPGSKNRPKAPPGQRAPATAASTATTAAAAAAAADDNKRDYVFNSDDENADEPMRYEEKRELSKDINKLTSDKLTKVLEIISAREANLNDYVSRRRVDASRRRDAIFASNFRVIRKK